MGTDELERFSKLTNTYGGSVIATQYDGFLHLFVGSSMYASPNTPTTYLTELYYFRQPILASITTSNYDSKYVDLPDNYIPDLIDRAVERLEMTKD